MSEELKYNPEEVDSYQLPTETEPLAEETTHQEEGQPPEVLTDELRRGWFEIISAPLEGLEKFNNLDGLGKIDDEDSYPYKTEHHAIKSHGEWVYPFYTTEYVIDDSFILENWSQWLNDWVSANIIALRKLGRDKDELENKLGSINATLRQFRLGRKNTKRTKGLDVPLYRKLPLKDQEPFITAVKAAESFMDSYVEDTLSMVTPAHQPIKERELLRSATETEPTNGDELVRGSDTPEEDME